MTSEIPILPTAENWGHCPHIDLTSIAPEELQKTATIFATMENGNTAKIRVCDKCFADLKGKSHVSVGYEVTKL